MCHLPRGAARVGGCAELHDVCVRVLLHEGDLALAGAVVGVVLFGRDDPVPPELVEIHR